MNLELDKWIQHKVNQTIYDLESIDVDLLNAEFTDSFAEMLEKLIILHCRVWHLEDEIGKYNEDDKKVAELKRKIDICFKQKRPALIEAMNRLIDSAIITNRSLAEESVKNYKGFNEN